MNIIDLDQLVPDDKVIKLGGREWSIPSDLPVAYMLRLIKVQQDIEQNGEDSLSQMKAFEIAHEIFAIRHPELTLEEFNKIINLKQFSVFIAALFGDFNSVEEVERAVSGSDQKKTVQEQEI